MTRLALPILRPVDGSGNPYPSGTLNFYDAGASTTPKTVYSDSALSVSLGSTVTADGEGLFADVYYSGDIRVVLKDKNGVIQSTKDIYGAGNIDTGDIVDGAVTTAKIDDNAVTLGKLLVLDNAKIITSNGVANSQVAISGDITMTNTGVMTIGTDKVTTTKILDGNVTTAKLETALQGQVLQHSAFVYLTADEAITAGTPTTPSTIDWDAAVETNLDAWDAGSPSRLTVPSGYTRARVSALIMWEWADGAGAGQGDLWMEIRKDGVGTFYPGKPRYSWATNNIATWSNGDQFSCFMQSPWITVSAGQYFTLYIAKSEDNGVILSGASDDFGSYFSIECRP